MTQDTHCAVRFAPLQSISAAVSVRLSDRTDILTTVATAKFRRSQPNAAEKASRCKSGEIRVYKLIGENLSHMN